MNAVPTIDIAELAAPARLEQALSAWSGFVELCPQAASRPGPAWLELPDRRDADWEMTDGLSSRPIAPLGCRFLRDVEVSGGGYFFSAERFIREHVHTSDVALQWLERPDFPDNPYVVTRPNRLMIDEPVLLVFGPGSNIFGHWLLDFLPRIVVAQRLLGAELDPFVLLLPSDAPGWVARMITYFCAIPPERIRGYDRMQDIVVCRHVCLPSFMHDGDYALHPMMREFYDGFGPQDARVPARRICLSRRDQEKHTHSYWRIFEARETFERLAMAEGYEIVQPELLDFADQIALFRAAERVIGEHGSGMHAAVFAHPGTVVATVGISNAIQDQIAALFEHRAICLRRTEILEQVPAKPVRFTAETADLQSLFSRIDKRGDLMSP